MFDEDTVTLESLGMFKAQTGELGDLAITVMKSGESQETGMSPRGGRGK